MRLRGITFNLSSVKIVIETGHKLSYFTSRIAAATLCESGYYSRAALVSKTHSKYAVIL